jgi:hypothetical protein
VAHSNGGLVAKAVMQELERLGKADKVDKIVLVSSPQMGTPLALLSMLYGYEEGSPWGILISRKDARSLSENMPGAYGLLPSAKYFERMENPFINFSSERVPQYKKFKDAYEENIDSFSEFKKFLLGTDDGRTEPAENDVELENVLHSNLLNEAEETHNRLDNWTPPSNVEIIQIAGWGLDTVSGVEYAEKENVSCVSVPGSGIPVCTGMGTYKPVYDPKFTVDGDAVVVAPSALMMEGGEKMKKYWVNLHESNTDPLINKNQSHKNILEVKSVKYFINKIITGVDLTSLPEYIFTSRPEDYESVKPRLRMSLYSPLDIHLYSGGLHTGPKTITDDNGNERTVFEEAIPNSYYYQFGDRKYVGFEGGENMAVEMEGYAEGAYTLKLEEVGLNESGEEVVVAHAVLENLPTMADTVVRFDIPEAGIAEPLLLQADLDGDGTDEYELASVPNGTATLDITPPEITGYVTAAPNANGWYNADATVHFEASDSGSGIESVSGDVMLSDEGAGQSVVGTATDRAGNSASFTVSGINIDKTAPIVKIGSPEEDKTYLNNQFLQLDYPLSDEISGLQNDKTKILYDGSVIKNDKIDLSLQNLGAHSFSVSIEDKAGNQAEKKIDFQIVANIEAISQNTDHYFDLKLIADEKTRNFLQVKISELIHIQEMIAKMGGKNNENPKANQIKLLNKKIDDLADFIQGKFSNLILSPAKEILIQSLNSVKM